MVPLTANGQAARPRERLWYFHFKRGVFASCSWFILSFNTYLCIHSIHMNEYHSRLLWAIFIFSLFPSFPVFLTYLKSFWLTFSSSSSSSSSTYSYCPLNSGEFNLSSSSSSAAAVVPSIIPITSVHIFPVNNSNKNVKKTNDQIPACVLRSLPWAEGGVVLLKHCAEGRRDGGRERRREWQGSDWSWVQEISEGEEEKAGAAAAARNL